MPYVPTGRPRGRPKKNLDPIDEPMPMPVQQAPAPVMREDQRTFATDAEVEQAKRTIWHSLCDSGNPSTAAAAAGCSYHQYKEWMREDGKFAEDVEDALEIFGHKLQDLMIMQSERHPQLLIAVAKKVQNGEYDSAGSAGTTALGKGKYRQPGAAKPGPKHDGDPDRLLGTDGLSDAEIQKRIREALKTGLPSKSTGVLSAGTRRQPVE